MKKETSGRPKKDEIMVLMGVRAPKSLWQALQLIAAIKGYTGVSILIRDILTDYVKRHGDDT